MTTGRQLSEGVIPIRWILLGVVMAAGGLLQAYNYATLLGLTG